MERGAQAVGRAASRAFTLATASITGFVTAGLAGTAEGEHLRFQFSELSREIAGVFLPVIEKITAGVRQLVGWFRALSGEQQDQIMKWSLIGLGVLAVAKVLPLVITGLKALTFAGLAAGKALAFLYAHPVLAGLAALAAAIAYIVEKLLSAEGAAAKLAREMARFGKGQITEDEFKASKVAQRIMAEKDPKKRAELAGQEAARLVAEQDKKLEELGRLGAPGPLRAFLRGWDVITGKFGDNVERLEAAAKEIHIARQLQKNPDFKPIEDPEKEAHRVPTRLQTGFEAFQETYRRLQLAVLRTEGGKIDPAERAAAAGEKLVHLQQQALDQLKQLKPAVVR